MKTDSERPSIESFEVSKEIEISAPIDIAFQAVLDEMGTECQMPGGKPFPMKVEPWPGGRWYRDLGNNSGHLWGHVQVIKPPTLLEIWGPLMMSFAAVNHLQYRFKAEGGVTRLVFRHSALGLIPPEFRENVSQGWQYWIERIRDLAEQKNPKGK